MKLFQNRQGLIFGIDLADDLYPGDVFNHAGQQVSQSRGVLDQNNRDW
jgi:hypothetical protein